MKVINPTEKPDFIEIPWAKTDHGEAPDNETINRPSPKPNKANQRHKKKNDEIFGLKFNGLSELHFVVGTDLIEKIFTTNFS